MWLNSAIIKTLNLRIGNYIEGLAAKNNKNEVVLRLNYWLSDYVGDGEIAGISDEIPRFEGVELICRKDYFDKICAMYKPNKPYRYRLKI